MVGLLDTRGRVPDPGFARPGERPVANGGELWAPGDRKVGLAIGEMAWTVHRRNGAWRTRAAPSGMELPGSAGC